MTIATKVYEELSKKKMDLDAETKVCNALWGVMLENSMRCIDEHNAAEAQAWHNAMQSITNRLDSIAKEYDELTRRFKEL